MEEEGKYNSYSPKACILQGEAGKTKVLTEEGCVSSTTGLTTAKPGSEEQLRSQSLGMWEHNILRHIEIYINKDLKLRYKVDSSYPKYFLGGHLWPQVKGNIFVIPQFHIKYYRHQFF